MYTLRYITHPSSEHKDEFTYEVETKKKAHIEWLNNARHFLSLNKKNHPDYKIVINGKIIEVVGYDDSIRLRCIKEY